MNRYSKGVTLSIINVLLLISKGEVRNPTEEYKAIDNGFTSPCFKNTYFPSKSIVLLILVLPIPI